LQGPLSASRYQILSTYPTYFNSSGYVSLSGTSFAAPIVSGVAALLASQNRSATQIRKRIQSTATDIGPVGRDNLFGTGLLNAKAAVGNSLTSARPADADVAPTLRPGSKQPSRRATRNSVATSERWSYSISLDIPSVPGVFQRCGWSAQQPDGKLHIGKQEKTERREHGDHDRDERLPDENP
jgi:hypothetical protein